MEWLKKAGKALLFPHGALLILLVPVSAALLIYAFAFPNVPDVLTYTSYAVSAYTLTALCCKAPAFFRLFTRIRQENRYIVRYQNDARLRVTLSLYGSLACNTAYAVFQLGLGVFHASVWFYAMAAYYALLAVMRFYLLLYTRTHSPGENRTAELCRYRFCGIALLVMNLALSVVVFYIIWKNQTFRYHQITTITLATYTFTTFIVAIVNMVRYRKYRSPVFSAAKAITFVDAMVSMLTLETAMLTVFGEAGQEDFSRLMTGCTGTVVLLAVLFMAIYMILRSSMELNALHRNQSPT